MKLHAVSRQRGCWNVEKPIFDGSIASAIELAKNRSRCVEQMAMICVIADVSSLVPESR